jgi:trypsin-like peptidase
MTRFRSSFFATLFLAGCATSSGVPVNAISQPDVAGAYIPLHSGSALSHAEGAAVVVAPGIAVTNGHNRNLVPPETVIGQARDYDLLFFRDPRTTMVAAADPQVGSTVEAYGQGLSGELRVAHGVVREIRGCSGCTVPAYFIFAGDAGPGFSGGPVLDPSGRLIGITFGYKNEGRERLIFAYPMSRVKAELSALPEAIK